MLDIRNAVVRYGAVAAVDDVTVSVDRGEFVVITGSNGSGKSSLIRAILGLVGLASGTISVGGTVATSPRDWRVRRELVAYVPQRTSPGAFPLLVEELLDSSNAVAEATAAAERLGIGALLHRPVTTLSGGQLQRAYLARAAGSVGRGATMIIADEPTSALDFSGQDDVGALLRELSVTRVVVSHDSAVVERADRVLEMAGGTLRERSA